MIRTETTLKTYGGKLTGLGWRRHIRLRIRGRKRSAKGHLLRRVPRLLSTRGRVHCSRRRVRIRSRVSCARDDFTWWSGRRRRWDRARVAESSINGQRLVALDRHIAVVPRVILPWLLRHAHNAGGACWRRGESVRAVDARTTRGWLRNSTDNGVAKAVMMQRRRLGRLRSSQVSLLIASSPVVHGAKRAGCSTTNATTRLTRIARMIEQCSDIVDEERVQDLGNLLLVCKVKRTLEWDPEIDISTLSKSSQIGDFSYQTPLRCIGPILTTWRTFSLLRIPSRRPRVIPATLRSLVPLIMWLSSRRATQTPLASTWKQRLPSSSHKVAVTRGFIPGGAIWPVVSN
jgi:hypothetical protein